MARSTILRLTDMRDAIEGITQLTAGADYDRFAQEWAMQRAVERGLEIISEASKHLSEEQRELTPEIPWPQVAAIGNLLRHEYQRADSLLIWNIVVEHLPRLKDAVSRLLAATDQP